MINPVHALKPCKIYFSVVRVEVFTSEGMAFYDVMFCSFVDGISVLEEPATSIIVSIEEEGSWFLSTSGFSLSNYKTSHPESSTLAF